MNNFYFAVKFLPPHLPLFWLPRIQGEFSGKTLYFLTLQGDHLEPLRTPLCLNSSIFACTSAATQFTCSPAGRVFSRWLQHHSHTYTRPFLMPALWWLCSLPNSVWRHSSEGFLIPTLPLSLPPSLALSLPLSHHRTFSAPSLPSSLCLSQEEAGCGSTLHTALWDPMKKSALL